MIQFSLRCGLAAATFATLVACGGSDKAMQPQTPATTTTTSSDQPVDTNPQSPTSPPTVTRMEPSISNPGISPATTTSFTTTTKGAPSTATTDNSSGMSDGQIVAVLDAANTGEIEQARIAIQKAKNDRVKKFAQHMVTDHGHAESKLKTLSTSAGISQQQGPASQQLVDGSQQIVQSLSSGTGASFDQMYMDAQIDEHKKVLDLIDRMLPQAQSSDLKSQLQETRTKVADHLQHAQEIRSSLGT